MSRWGDDMPANGHADDEDDSDGEAVGTGHKVKSRRKSHQRPQGSDQIRQAFSKRKKGLVLKAYQLSSLTDAKVFMFIVNDKGTSWAYATPDFACSLDPNVLNELKSLAGVPEPSKLFTEVIPHCQAPRTNSRGSSEQTGTQRTEPSAECVAPSMRAAAGCVPSHSRSSYSWGSDGHAQHPPSADKLTRTASSAVATRTTQATPQSDEHSPTMPKTRPPSGSSMACNTRASTAAGGTGCSYQYPQHPHGAGRGPGMDPPTPCVFNLLGQPTSAQNSPSEVAMPCRGSPSSKLMPPPDAATTGRVLAASAAHSAACAASASGLDGHATAAGSVTILGEGVQEEQPTAGHWMDLQQQQQRLQEGEPSWGSLYQQQPCMQQEHLHAQHQHFAQPQCQQPRGVSRLILRGDSATADRNTPAGFDRACTGPSAPEGFAPGAPSWGLMSSACFNAGAAAASVSQLNTHTQHLQPVKLEQGGAQSQESQDAFAAMQRGLAPLRLAKPAAAGGVLADADGARSAPAGDGTYWFMGAESYPGQFAQWLHFPDCGAGTGDGPASLRAASDAGVYSSTGCQQYSSYTPSTGTQLGVGSGTSSAVMVGGPNAARALLMANCGSLSQGSSPTAVLGQRMANVLAMRSPSESPLHPSAVAEQAQHSHMFLQQQQQQHLWQQQQHELNPGPGSGPPSQTGFLGHPDVHLQQQQQQQQQQQHDQGSYMPKIDDLLSDPIMDMLMDQPLAQLTAGNEHPVHPSLMQETLEKDPPQPGHIIRSEADPAGASTMWEAPQGPTAAGAGLVPDAHVDLLSLIPRPPQSHAPADVAAWQAEVRRILGTLQPHQRHECEKILKQQWLVAQAGSREGGGSDAGQLGASACSGPSPPVMLASGSSGASGPHSGGYARMFGGKRVGPSRLSASTPAAEHLPAAPAADVGAPQQLQAATNAANHSFFSQHLQPPSVCQGLASGCDMQQALPYPTVYSSMPLAAQSFEVAAPQATVHDLDATQHVGCAADQQEICPVPACSAPVSCTGAHMMGARLEGFSQGTSCPMLPDSGVCAGQMLPLPSQQQPSTFVPVPAFDMEGSCKADAIMMSAVPKPQAQGSSFMQVSAAAGRAGFAQLADGGRGSCPSSPLKRTQPCSVMDPALEAGASPMKKACISTAFHTGQQQVLPEPPSFATLLQAEATGEDDAIAWAAAGGGGSGDFFKRVAGSCVSLGGSANLGSMDSFPSSFLRLGSLQGIDSMQVLPALPDDDDGADAKATTQTGIAPSQP